MSEATAAQRSLLRHREFVGRYRLGLPVAPSQDAVGITQQEAAELAGVHLDCYALLESGRNWRGTPQAVVERVADALMLPEGDRQLLLEQLARAHRRKQRPAVVERFMMWWSGTVEIGDLTRDFTQEERATNAAATVLVPGPWNIALLFRRRPHPCAGGRPR